MDSCRCDGSYSASSPARPQTVPRARRTRRGARAGTARRWGLGATLPRSAGNRRRQRCGPGHRGGRGTRCGSAPRRGFAFGRRCWSRRTQPRGHPRGPTRPQLRATAATPRPLQPLIRRTRVAAPAPARPRCTARIDERLRLPPVKQRRGRARVVARHEGDARRVARDGPGRASRRTRSAARRG